MQRKTRESSEAALSLWNYFYLLCCPTENEQKAWRRIECATIRIRDSEPYLRAQYPAVVRLRNAKRVRRATREIVRLVDELESIPEPWVASAVGLLEGLAEVTIEASKEEAKRRPAH